jgi:hypothetical protein
MRQALERIEIEMQPSSTLRRGEMTAFSVAEFVERYLPEQYARTLASFATMSSPAAFGLEVAGHGSWSLIAASDGLTVQPSLVDDRVLTASLSGEDFERLIMHDLPAPTSAPIGQRVLRWDTETLGLVKAMPGSVLVSIADSPSTRKVLLTPGARAIDLASAACTIECELKDLLDVRAGIQQPMELFLAGKIRLLGDAQLALALAGILI